MAPHPCAGWNVESVAGALGWHGVTGQARVAALQPTPDIGLDLRLGAAGPLEVADVELGVLAGMGEDIGRVWSATGRADGNRCTVTALAAAEGLPAVLDTTKIENPQPHRDPGETVRIEVQATEALTP